MTGERRVDQTVLFYEFSLEGHALANPLPGSIDRFAEREGLRAPPASCHGTTGCP